MDIKDNLKNRLEQIKEEAEIAVREGTNHLILSDQNISEDRANVPMILAVGAVNSNLVKNHIRGYASINVQTSEAMDTHSFAILIGVGATTVNPYLAQDCIYDRFQKGLFGKLTFEECVQRYKKAVDQGLLKVMSKLGISVISSYRGGFNFEAIGLSRSMVNEYFLGVQSRMSGIGLTGIQKKLIDLHNYAYSQSVSTLPIGGIFRYRYGEEIHAYDGKLIHLLQTAVSNDSYDLYKKYSLAHKNFSKINITNREEISIGVPKNYFFDDIDPDIKKAILSAANKFDNLGYKVEEIEIPFVEEGRSVFCQHVVSCGKNVRIGSDVPVLYKNKVIGVGKAVLSTSMISNQQRGVAIKIRDSLKSQVNGEILS